MEDHIPLSYLNDFTFCPYSIYLHQAYMERDESLYHAAPQVRGRIAHQTIDLQKSGHKRNEIRSINVTSNTLGLSGVIDTYQPDKKLLIERKYKISHIYQGQIYQLWGQYYCMIEMDYEVTQIAFYESSTNKMLYQPIPTDIDYHELCSLITQIRTYDPASTIPTSTAKCTHCIYAPLCDKTEQENVYS